jgi:uncharacterized protein YaaN involved in tellurite resistance
MSQPAEAAATEQPLILTPPQPVAPVDPGRADQMVKLTPEVISKLDSQVEDFVAQVVANAPDSAAFKDRTKAIMTVGDAEIRASSNVSNRMLERPVRAMERGGLSETAGVSHALLDLRHTVERLDPSSEGDLLSPRKLLGMIPFGNKLTAYFDRFRSAQSHIQAVLNALYRGKEELERDNASIEEEKVNLWGLMGKIEQYAYVLKKLDARLEEQARRLEPSDPAKAKIIREDILFYARQKTTDLLTQLAVDVQGYLALDMIRKTNIELIKGVDRATTTTISALRTAVMVALALNNQKLVLDQVTALNTTTGNLIEGTAAMLRKQSGKVFDQAASATVDVDKLKRAFQNIYATIDHVSDFKTKALAHMSQTVQALSVEVDKSKAYLDRVRQAEGAAAVADLSKPDSDVVKL